MEKAEEGRWNAPLGSPAQPLGAAAWDTGLYPSLFQPAFTPNWANHFLTLCLIVTAMGQVTQWSRCVAHPNRCRQRDLGADCRCSWVTIFSVNFNFCLHNATQRWGETTGQCAKHSCSTVPFSGHPLPGSLFHPYNTDPAPHCRACGKGEAFDYSNIASCHKGPIFMQGCSAL